MSLDLSAPLRTALINSPTISGLLSEWNEEPAIFTRRPVPSSAMYPFILVSPNVVYLESGPLANERATVVRDILVYGDQEDHYRIVETISNEVRELFHRTRFSISVSGYRVVLITATGPNPAPTDDEKSVARVVTLTVLAQRV